MTTKKLFHALRSAAALRWLRPHGDAPILPTPFPTQIAERETARDVAAMTADYCRGFRGGGSAFERTDRLVRKMV